MLEFYKTYGTVTKKLEQPEPGCWISAVAPTQEDIDFLTNKIGVLPEFIKSSLDEEESSHIDYDDDENQTLVIVDYPSAEEDDNLDENTLLYMNTRPSGLVTPSIAQIEPLGLKRISPEGRPSRSTYLSLIHI